MRDLQLAINEYNASLQVDPNHARSLYGRGPGEDKNGDRNGGSADTVAAVKLVSRIGEDFARFNVTQ